jgi:hypothetical protein
MSSREIKTHKTNECNEAITITADEPDVSYGNASHCYTLSFIDKEGRYAEVGIDFQRGPIKEVGVNGLTNEALLAVLIDRMEGFQSGEFACDDNREVLNNLLNASRWLQERTLARMRRGVEGTNIV